MFLHVTEVACIGEYKLRIHFNNDTVKEVDLKKELYGEIFEPLRNVDYFRKVCVSQETGTIEWPNGADFAPEFLYEMESRATLSDCHDDRGIPGKKEEASAGLQMGA